MTDHAETTGASGEASRPRASSRARTGSDAPDGETGGAKLTRGPITGHLVGQTLPAIVGVAAIMSIGLVDAFFIGQLGSDVLAAIAFIFPISVALTSLGVGSDGGDQLGREPGTGRAGPRPCGPARDLRCGVRDRDRAGDGGGAFHVVRSAVPADERARRPAPADRQLHAPVRARVSVIAGDHGVQRSAARPGRSAQDELCLDHLCGGKLGARSAADHRCARLRGVRYRRRGLCDDPGLGLRCGHGFRAGEAHVPALRFRSLETAQPGRTPARESSVWRGRQRSPTRSTRSACRS